MTLRLVRAALAATSFLSIYACAGGATSSPPVRSAPGGGAALSRFPAAYPTKGLFLFEGDEGAAGLQIYRGDLKRNPAPIAVIRRAFCPYGMVVDKNGTLYVAIDCPNLDQVLLIPRGTSNVIPLNLQDLIEPLNVAFDPNGNLWVTDGAGDRVNIYPPGSQTPSHSLTGFGFPYAISIDSAGEAAITDLGSNRAVFLFRPGQYTPFAVLTNGVNTPTGVLLTRL